MLCDKGWREVWRALEASRAPHVQRSLDAWFPPESGLRARIDAIHDAHPEGFVVDRSRAGERDELDKMELEEGEGSAMMDLALLELQRCGRRAGSASMGGEALERAVCHTRASEQAHTVA